MNMIKELYEGNLDVSRLHPKADSEYWKALDGIGAFLDKAKETWGWEQSESLENAIIDLEGVMSKDSLFLAFNGAQNLCFPFWVKSPIH